MSARHASHQPQPCAGQGFAPCAAQRQPDRFGSLRRMQPAEVQTPPLLLRYRPTPYNRALFSVSRNAATGVELDDEWGESSLSSEVPSVVLRPPASCSSTRTGATARFR